MTETEEIRKEMAMVKQDEELEQEREETEEAHPGTCPFIPKGVLCAAHVRCNICGWNPAAAEARRRVIRRERAALGTERPYRLVLGRKEGEG